MNKSDIVILVLVSMIVILAGYVDVKEYKQESTGNTANSSVPEVKTEILTHVIRCTAYVNDTCTEYKVYKIVKE